MQEVWSYAFDFKVMVTGKFPVADDKAYLAVGVSVNGAPTKTLVYVMNVFPELNGGAPIDRVIEVRIDNPGAGET